MRIPTPKPRKTLGAIAIVLALAGCQTGQGSHPVPSVAQIGSDLKCAAGDHGFEDAQVGWGFCYPGSWKYAEKSQSSQSPAPVELDLTFDITNAPATPVPCPSATPSAAASPAGDAECSGQFAFMIVSTFERNNAPDLATWRANNVKPSQALEPITWGNAVEAGRLADGRRVALTQHQVVILDLHPATLDLEAAMSSRLDTWRFSY